MENTAHTGPLLVGYDGRDASKRALERALQEAQLRGVDVAVLVVAGLHFTTTSPYDPSTLDLELIPPIPEGGPIEIQGLLDDARQVLAASSVEGTVDWAMGDPVTEILAAAKRLEASAIVIGSHHHSALGRFFGTDTAEEIIHAAGCDVIVAREPEPAA